MTESNPRVTVIMIVHNGAALIEQGIRSVLQQAYQDRELLVVDDGSTDDTARVVERLAREHPGQIRLITHPDGRNHGMSATRRLGVESSDSPLLMFLDHDDLMVPGALGEMVDRMDEQPGVDVVFGPNERFWTDAQGRDLGRPTVVQTLGFGLDRVAEPPGITATFLADSSQVPISPLIRREAYHDVGGYEAKFKGMYEDQVFLAKLLLEKRIFLDSRRWIRYRQHEESCVARSFSTSRNAHHRGRFLKWLSSYLEARRVRNTQLSHIIDSELIQNRETRRRESRQRLVRMLRRR